MKTYLLSLFLMLAALPAFASTPIVLCPGHTVPISSAGTYVLQNDISTAGDDCFVIHNQNQDLGTYGYADIDCNGFSITLTGSYHAVVGSDNAGSSYMHGCNVIPVAVGTEVIKFTNSSTMAGNYTVMYGNHLNGGYQTFDSTLYALSFYNTFGGGYTQFKNNSDYAESVGESYIFTSGSVFGAVQFEDSNYGYVNGNTITGGGSTLFAGVTLKCVNNLYCTNPTVDTNTITSPSAGGVVFSGVWYNPAITNNTITKPGSSGLACFPSLLGNCSFQSGNFSSNAVEASPATNNTSLVDFETNGTGSSFLNASTFSGNTLSIGSASSFGDSTIGISGQFGITGNNTLTSNTFGAGTTLNLNGNTGFNDGTGNICAVTNPNPSQIICH